MTAKAKKKVKKKAESETPSIDGIKLKIKNYEGLLPIDEFKPSPTNPYTHPDRQVKKLAEIYKGIGITRPIWVSKRSGLISAGHCRLKAAQLLGLSKFPVAYVNYDSQDEELAALIEDNKIAELAEINGLAMADTLVELDQNNYPLELTAMDVSEIEQYVLGPITVSEPQDEENEEGILARIGIYCPHESSKALKDEIEPLLSKYEGAKFA